MESENREFEMKEEKDRAVGLELAPGLNGIRYDQKFVRAPKSAYPTKASPNGKEVPVNDPAMKMSCGE